MNYSLSLFYRGSFRELLLLLFAENLIIALSAVIMGIFLLKTLGEPFNIPDKRERKFFLLTILLNTLLTYFGFVFWSVGIITIKLRFNPGIITDFIFLVLIMDVVTWLIHYILHTKPFFEKIHYLSHANKNLNPASLFVVHPIETLMFGFSWLLVLTLFTFNIYAIISYLVFNITLGVISNLGINHITTRNSFSKIFISPAFRLEHHKSGNTNFGYHTKIWDNVFRTLSASYTNFAKNTL